MTHPCDTCGGTGEEMHPLHWTRKEWRTRVYTGKAPRCPVCLGAGSFPDRMPAADALADAETLHQFGEPSDGDLVTVTIGLGVQAKFWIKDTLKYCSRWDGDEREESQEWARKFARDAARAAFRAVPALRGKE